MEQITPFDWQRIFVGNQPPLYFLEIIFRTILIYGFTIVVLRYLGKRGQRHLSPFESVVVIALGSATGDSMLYPEVPILYAWLVIGVIVLLSKGITVLQFYSKPVNIFLEGEPRLMLKEGKIIMDSLQREWLCYDEFLEMLREKDIKDIGEVEYAFLERSGQLGLFRYDHSKIRQEETTYPSDLER